MARLAEIRVQGLRSIADVSLSLDGLIVLIGDNGSGKSSVLEALRIAQLATGPEFAQSLDQQHMLYAAVGQAGLSMQLRVEVEDEHLDNLVYDLCVDPQLRVITAETIHGAPPGYRLGDAGANLSHFISRTSTSLQPPAPSGAISPYASLFQLFGPANSPPEVNIIREALAGIDSHLPFDVTAGWANRVAGRNSAIREPRLVAPSRRLELFGANLANVYQTLKNSGSDRWQETLELLQLGFGAGLKDVSLSAAGSGGHLGLSLELRGQGHVPALHLADGQLSYLAFVALVQLDEGRTLLSFDEPESHLHPALLGRVLQLFERAASRYPVVIATHSDRLLDFLPNPAKSVRVCELDGDYRTRLRTLDGGQLDKWMKRYRGLGQVRAEGHLDSVLAVVGDREGENSAA